MKYAMSTVIASCLLMGCSWPIKPSTPDPKPLPVASCPVLTPLQSDTMAAVTLKLVEVSGIYYQCRAAAGIK